jgi:hypothetical protein
MKPDQGSDTFSIVVDYKKMDIVSWDGFTAESEPSIYATHAPWDWNHCWVATASNMLYAAGYLSVSAEKCYEILNKRYYIKDGGSEGGNVQEILNDLAVKNDWFGYYKHSRNNRVYYFSTISEGLKSIESNKGKIVGAISFAGHVITCYEYRSLLNGGYITYADSDDDQDNRLSTNIKIARISKNRNEWFIHIYGEKLLIEEVHTLIANNTDKKIGLTGLEFFEIVSHKVHSGSYSGISTSENGNVTVNGHIYDSVILDEGVVTIASGAEAEEMTVHGGGTVNFDSGAIAKGTIRTTGGTLTVESGVDVSGAEFDFAVSHMENGSNAPLLNSLGNVSGSKLTITVMNGQSAGKYVLAGDAADFEGTLSVVGEYNYMNDVGEGFDNGLIGDLGLDNTLCIEGRTYSLMLDGDNLALVISAEREKPFGLAGDFDGDGNAMLITETDGVFTIYENGAEWGVLTLDDGWEIAGVGDFNADGRDDFLRVNEEGYVVGEMSNGNGTFSPQVLNFKNEGWQILGTGDFNGNGTDDVLVANPTGASETVGLLGYWESGTEWTLINGYSPEWECVGTGDFNGDGLCDMLWRNFFEGEDEEIYNAYCTWLMEPSDGLTDWRMVSVANPGEWSFLCSGDFDGDDTSDIAMINDEGVVGIWGVENGFLSSWSILSAVTQEWQLAGVADINGDGTDDIAWCSSSTGQVGAWMIEDKTLANWQVLATIG